MRGSQVSVNVKRLLSPEGRKSVTGGKSVAGGKSVKSGMSGRSKELAQPSGTTQATAFHRRPTDTHKS